MMQSDWDWLEWCVAEVERDGSKGQRCLWRLEKEGFRGEGSSGRKKEYTEWKESVSKGGERGPRGESRFKIIVSKKSCARTLKTPDFLSIHLLHTLAMPLLCQHCCFSFPICKVAIIIHFMRFHFGSEWKNRRGNALETVKPYTGVSSDSFLDTQMKLFWPIWGLKV